MFDDVFDETQWKKARDATGLKGSLTEKVSMGDEFKRFQHNKNVAGAKFLLQKITLYEKQLKDKHTKEKYYAKLLKVVQDQKTTLEAGIQAVENPPPTGVKVEDVNMDQVVDEVIAREQEHAREYENTTNDPNVPVFPGEAKRVYLKLTKEFPTVEEKIKTERANMADLLQKCKALQTSPALQTKPDKAIAVAQVMFDTVNKILTKANDLHGDFMIEAQVVGKEQGREDRATKALDALVARLSHEMEEIAGMSRDCFLALKNALQPLGGNPQAQEILRRLQV